MNVEPLIAADPEVCTPLPKVTDVEAIPSLTDEATTAVVLLLRGHVMVPVVPEGPSLYSGKSVGPANCFTSVGTMLYSCAV